LEWPGEKAVVKSLSTDLRLYHPYEVVEVKMLGVSERIQWERGESGLTCALPKERPCRHAYSLRITGRVDLPIQEPYPQTIEIETELNPPLTWRAGLDSFHVQCVHSVGIKLFVFCITSITHR